MFKIIVFLVITLITTAMAKSSMTEYKTSINNISKNNIVIQNSDKFSLGSSGVVIHTFDDTHKTIIATVEVIDKKGDYATLKYKNFDALKQDALPTYKITPQKGDSVILNFLYKRALAITPNKKTFQYITGKSSSIDWIHPDIFASKLYIDYTPKPTKEDFKIQCTQSNFALLFFAISNKGYFVDCNSFKVLDKINLPNTLAGEKKQVPFYSRYEKIEGRIFNLMGGESMINYDRYYKKLLGL